MEVNFTAASIAGYGIAAVFGWFSYLIFWLIWRRKTGEGWFPVVSGIVAYILISLVRGILNIIFLRGFLANYFTAGLISGVCEEAGKFLVFRYVLYEKKNPGTAISYAVGHGGTESVFVCGINGISHIGLIIGLAYRIMDREKFMGYLSGTEEEKYQFVSQYAQTGFFGNMLTVFDILSGMALCAALSVLVFMAVHSDNTKKLLLYAAGIHTADDFIRGQMFGGQISIERTLVSLCITAGTVYFVYMIYRKYSEENTYMDFGGIT